MQTPSVDLDRHRRIRAILRTHQNAAVKTIPKHVLHARAVSLGMLDGDKLYIESEAELTILMDHCIYGRHKSDNLVTKYLARLRASRDPLETLVRQAMAQARFSIVRVKRLRRGVGFEAQDVLWTMDRFVVDEGLSLSARKRTHVAGHLIPVDDYWMTTGAVFPLTYETADAAVEMFKPRLNAADADHDAVLAELESVVLGSALEDGAGTGIKYL